MNKVKHLFLKAFLFFYVATSLVVTGCSTESAVIKKDYTSLSNREAEKFILIVKQYNNLRPDNVSADISFKASFSNKSFSAKGTLNYFADPLALRIKLTDPIFSSILADLFLQENTTKLYVPIDNTVYINSGQSEFSLNPCRNPKFAAETMLGEIPLLRNPRIIKSYVSTNTDGKGTVTRIINIDNATETQAIEFNNDTVEKVIIKSKSTLEKTEIIYAKPVNINGITVFSLVSAVSEPSGDSIRIEYKNLKLNLLKDRDKITRFEIPKGTKIVE